MSDQFFFQCVTGSCDLADLGIDQAVNPFCTDSYARAMQQLGYECWVVGVRADGIVRDAAIAIVRRGRISAALEFASLPAAAQGTLFWDGVNALSKRLKVTDMIAGTFASSSFEIPLLRGEFSRQKRMEYVLALDNEDFEARLSTNVRKNIKKARACGVTLRRGSELPESPAEHARMIGHSRERRVARGETVSPSPIENKEHLAYLTSGAGELFQAMHKGCVVSSLLVLRSSRYAYCQSTGTSPEGMKLGASHFLFHAVCGELKRQGVRTINLGGAQEGSSLAEFKSGFGARHVPLVECACYVGSVWLKKLRSGLRLARTNPAQFRRVLSGNSYRVFVYARATDAPPAAIPTPDGARFQPLSKEDLILPSSSTEEAEFYQRQLDRFHQLGEGLAYGVFVGERLAHVSWLLPPATVAMERPRFLTLEDGEAEITGSETLPWFRGRMLYPFAIQQIIEVAQTSGIRRIYMKTRKENGASQSGILKAGLHLTGAVTVVTPPAISSKTFVLRRFRTAP